MNNPITNLVQELKKLPGIGERTAERLAFSILRGEKDYANRLSSAITDLKDKIKFCSVCLNFTTNDPCSICSDAKRSNESVCVVADPADVAALEKTRAFRGKYHVLHGLISPLDGVGPSDIKLDELTRRLRKDKEIREVIIATDATVEGEATALYISKLLKPMSISASRLALGVPMGAKLHYLDSATLALALDRRIK